MASILVTIIKSYVGTAAERAALSTTGLQAGSTFEESDTGLKYKWSGTAWFQGSEETMQLIAGTALVGKVGIDQTTDGTTNKVVANVASGGIASGAVASGAIAAGALADGALVTLGAKADAKSAATDTTAITAMQVLKEISYMEQNPASRAVTGTFYQTTQPVSVASAQIASGAIVDGADVTQGAKADAAATIADATSFSVVSLLKGIWNRFLNLGFGGAAISTSNPVPVKSDSLASSATFTRPNDVTLYTAGDIVGAAVTANITFANVIAAAAGMFCILSVMLEIDAAAIPSGMTNFKLHLFNAAPTAIADNAVWALADADRAKYLGPILLDIPVDMGGTLWSQTENVNFVRKLAAGSITLYGMLETVGGYTPTASVVKTITINVMGV